MFGLGTAALIVLAVLTSCVSEEDIRKQAYAWDDSLPEDQTALVQFAFGLSVKSYNGISLDAKNPFYQARVGTSGLGKFLLLPAGDAVFVVDVETPDYMTKNAPFKVHLEAGKKYCFWFKVLNWYDIAKWIWGVNVYDELVLGIGDISRLEKENFVEFVPFIQASRENRILE
jgi:hypothetical protein